MAHRRPLDVRQILAWADAHFARTGQYPDVTCGPVVDAPWEKWLNIDGNLRRGNRGLPGGWSLAQLLDELRGKRNRQNLPRHTIDQILAWANAHYERTATWPGYESGAIEGAPDETWQAVDMALRAGVRGLSGGSSLARLLRSERGVRRVRHRRERPETERLPIAKADDTTAAAQSNDDDELLLIELLRAGRNIQALPPFTVEGILTWADDFFASHGKWPGPKDGLIAGTLGETWRAVDMALNRGLRGLTGDSSLAYLLAEHRGVRNKLDLPPISVEQVLTWADAFHARTGDWPTILSGPVDGGKGDTWLAIDKALRAGRRGLPAGWSLARLIDAHRGTHRAQNPAPLSVTKILEWADAWYLRYGKWPKDASGSIPESPGDTWNAVSMALRHGLRDLPGGMSLAQFLADRRGKRNRAALPPLTEDQILAWADAYHERHGKWPTQTSGRIIEAPGETWNGVDRSLVDGRRGLSGGSSLPRLLAQRRGKRYGPALLPLTEEQILAWADAHYARHGRWPSLESGRVSDAPGETWNAIDQALKQGYRGRPGGSSLAQLLDRCRRNVPATVGCATADAVSTPNGDRPEATPIFLTPPSTNGRAARIRPK